MFRKYGVNFLDFSTVQEGFSLLSVYWELPFFFFKWESLSPCMYNCIIIVNCGTYENVKSRAKHGITFCGLCLPFAAFKQNKGTWRELLQCSRFLNCLGTAASRSDVRVQIFLFFFTLMDYWLWVAWECDNVSFPNAKLKNWN